MRTIKCLLKHFGRSSGQLFPIIMSRACKSLSATASQIHHCLKLAVLLEDHGHAQSCGSRHRARGVSLDHLVSPFIGRANLLTYSRLRVGTAARYDFRLVLCPCVLISVLRQTLVALIQGSQLTLGSAPSAYIDLGEPSDNLLTASITSFPTTIAIRVCARRR